MHTTCGKCVPAKRFFLLALAVGILGVTGPAAAQTNAAPLRPFYIIGHESDTLAKAEEYMRLGANGLECNVNTFPGRPRDLCIGHGPWLGSGPAGNDAVPLVKFLQGLHQLALAHTNFCLVYFDCKSPVAKPELGRQLLADIRTYYVGEGTNALPLSFILSVGKLRDKAMFADIASSLGPRESIMVDGYSRPGEVAVFFDTTGATNRCFSDGTVPFNTCLSHFEIYWAIKKACHMRERQHSFCFIGTWTVNNPLLMRNFIKMGVDAIVTDKKFIWYNFSWENLGHGLQSLKRIVRDEGPRLGIRLATREDNPFQAHR